MLGTLFPVYRDVWAVLQIVVLYGTNQGKSWKMLEDFFSLKSYLKQIWCLQVISNGLIKIQVFKTLKNLGMQWKYHQQTS